MKNIYRILEVLFVRDIKNCQAKLFLSNVSNMIFEYKKHKVKLTYNFIHTRFKSRKCFLKNSKFWCRLNAFVFNSLLFSFLVVLCIVRSQLALKSEALAAHRTFVDKFAIMCFLVLWKIVRLCISFIAAFVIANVRLKNMNNFSNHDWKIIWFWNSPSLLYGFCNDVLDAGKKIIFKSSYLRQFHLFLPQKSWISSHTCRTWTVECPRVWYGYAFASCYLW